MPQESSVTTWLRRKHARFHADNAINDPERTQAFFKNVVQPRIALINEELQELRADNYMEYLVLTQAMQKAYKVISAPEQTS